MAAELLASDAGALIDRYPSCPRRVSLVVDRITLRLDWLAGREVLL